MSVHAWLPHVQTAPISAKTRLFANSTPRKAVVHTTSNATSKDERLIIKGLQSRLWLRPILQVHDEVDFELPADKVEEAVEFVKSCMEQQPFEKFDVPIIAEAEVGKSFGTLHEFFKKEG